MAFFKFRKGGDDQTAAPPPKAPVTVETMRKRARHRLIGAAVLVLVGVIGFPLLFDSQPRPIAVDIVIEIPDKNQVQRLKAPASTRSKTESAVNAPAAQATPAPTPAAPTVSASRQSSGNVSGATVADASAKPVPKAESKPDPKAASKDAVNSAPPAAAAKAATMIEERDSDKKPAASEARFVVQVGAFSDAAKAREVRAKLERAGLKTYTQVVEPKEGRRIRVRVGPFVTKIEADKAAEKIKKLDLPAGILEL